MGISSFNDSFTSTSRNLSAGNVSATTGSPVTGTENGYAYYIFTGSGSITFAQSGLCDVLVVGAGASGAKGSTTGGDCGGGGGAGAAEYHSGFYVDASSYTVTVGAGGAGMTTNANLGNAGDKSVFGNLVAVGGGPGGSSVLYRRQGINGACGGGGGTDASQSAFSGGIGLFGYNGGAASLGNGGGGGGGLGAAGADSPGSNIGGAGGIGAIFTIISDTVATAESVGEVSGTDVYFCGGGGGGGDTTGGAAGTGGGGAGTAGTTVGTNGSANTGGGGGGCENANSGSGGSGVVIVRVRA